MTYIEPSPHATPNPGGSIDYKELQKALKRRVALDPSMAPGAVKIELTAKNKSTREKMQSAGGKVVAANRMKGEKGAALNSEVQIDMNSDVPVQERPNSNPNLALILLILTAALTLTLCPSRSVPTLARTPTLALALTLCPYRSSYVRS